MRVSPRRLAAAYLEAAAAVPPAEQPKVAHALIAYVTRRRLRKLLPRVAAAVARLLDERRGTMPVRITTARPVEPAALSKAVGVDVAVTVTVDPQVLGGAIVERGDTRFDGSVRGRLRQLHQHLRQSVS